MFDFNSQDRVQRLLLIAAGTLILMAVIMTFTRQIMLALIIALVAILFAFISKAISSAQGAKNAPPNLPDHVDDLRGRVRE